MIDEDDERLVDDPANESGFNFNADPRTPTRQSNVPFRREMNQSPNKTGG